MNSRLWRRHKSSVIFGALVLTSLAFSHQDIARNMQQVAESKEAIAANSKKQAQLEVQLQFENEQAAIANARYENGCLPVVAENRKYVSIKEGRVVKDRLTKQPLPANTVVCDGNGNTGVVLPDGTVGKVAFTGDRDMVAKRLRRFRAGTYSQPIDGGNEE